MIECWMHRCSSKEREDRACGTPNTFSIWGHLKESKVRTAVYIYGTDSSVSKLMSTERVRVPKRGIDVSICLSSLQSQLISWLVSNKIVSTVLDLVCLYLNIPLRMRFVGTFVRHIILQSWAHPVCFCVPCAMNMDVRQALFMNPKYKAIPEQFVLKPCLKVCRTPRVNPFLPAWSYGTKHGRHCYQDWIFECKNSTSKATQTIKSGYSMCT